MEKEKHNAWLLWMIGMRCNLDCEYCFENPMKKTAKPTAVDIDKFMNTLDKTGKTFRIFMTGGGEPSLIPNFRESLKTKFAHSFIL
jgi:MoaA/NifB/PqqE/SkfB family radical SAM enzyme